MKENKLLLLLTPLLLIAGFLIYRAVAIPDLEPTTDYYSQGQALIRQGKITEAKQVLSLGKEKYPVDGRYDFALGNIYRQEKDMKNALLYYDQAIKKTPSLPEAYNNIAAIFMLDNRLDEALNTINDGLAKQPDFKDLQFKKGQILFMKGTYSDAIQVLQPLTAVPEYVDAYRFIGLSYVKDGKREQAAEALQLYLQKVQATTQGSQEIEKLLQELKK
ncbi:tetratricopeptide repeat protein [Paenibacillus silviterrae]|uniref:tetratricopeptide repeat protein n=1 Tax=Paenibacillus silviterrae TaxID=3242194 RepID=UPI0025431D62|nr:tetratricopeptide repeat protein [Paenibacillus chinjuensis]